MIEPEWIIYKDSISTISLFLISCNLQNTVEREQQFDLWEVGAERRNFENFRLRYKPKYSPSENKKKLRN